MKTIGQRAEEYISKFREEPKSKEEHIQCVIDFTAGAVSEREELLKWNNPKVELPDNDLFCLGKTLYHDEISYELLFYKSKEKQFISRRTFLPIMPPELIGWREIHE